MKTVINIALALIVLGSVSLLIIAKKDNDSFYNDLLSTRTKADSLVKASDLLQTNAEHFKNLLDSQSAKNEKLKLEATRAASTLVVRERTLRETHQSLQDVSKKYSDLLSLQKETEKQMSSLKTSDSQHQKEIESLRNQMASASETNKQLNSELVSSRLAAKDNISIETLAKNGRPLSRGKKTRKIVTSFNLPGEIKDPSFRIFDPNGTQLPESNGSFHLQMIKDSAQTPSSNDQVKLELTYVLSGKLGSGSYRIEILSENKHTGNLLIRFR